jgi:hypothetical protein
MRKTATILITVIAWSILLCLHAYYWVSSCMADSSCREYEGIWILPLVGYTLYFGPFWILGLIVVVILEWVFVPNRRSLVSGEILKA